MMEKRCWFQIFIIFWALIVVVPYEADGAYNSNMTTTTTSSTRSGSAAAGCNLFDGSWVLDPSYPPYNSNTCPFIDPEFDCQKYGRPDSGYQKYAWKPLSCTLPRFDGLDFLKRWKGKKIMLVGDSLSYNMWLSLACMIHASAPNLKTSHNTGTVSSIIFQEYEVTLLFHRQPFLVDVVQEKVGRVLKIDSIQTGAKTWLGMDLLIFNSWHWWTHTGKYQAWDYMEMEGKLYKDMDRLTAYSKGLATWAKWVDLNVNPSSTKVFFKGISPTHYQGEEWNQPKQNCKGQTAPLPGSTYPAGLPPQTSVVNNVLKSMKKTSVNLLDITTLSQLRIDAHPSLYSGQHPGNDCAHWCLPGLPDTWNQLLYALLS